MDEKQIYEREDEIVISFRKIWDNFVKYWWVCLITTALGIFAVIGITMNTYRANLESEKELEEEEEDEQEGKNYQSVSMVYLQPNNTEQELVDIEALKRLMDSYGEVAKITGLEAFISSYVQQININKNSQLLYDCKALLESDRVISEVVNALKKKGYKPYDMKKDRVDIRIIDGSRCYTLTARGKDKERTEFIVNTITDALVDTVDSLGIKDSNIIDYAVTNYCIKEKVEGQKGEYTVRVVTKEELEKWEEEQKEEEKDEEEKGLGIRNFISMKKLLLIFAGGFFGFGIIFLFVLFDKKIRTKDEFAIYFKLPYLGEFKKRVKNSLGTQYDVLATSLLYKCEKEDVKTLMLTTPVKLGSISEMVDNLTAVYKSMGESVKVIAVTSEMKDIEKQIETAKANYKLVLAVAEGASVNPKAIQTAKITDGVVIVVETNSDNVPDIEKAVNYIVNANGTLVGYVLKHL